MIQFTRIELSAPAKINLALYVLGRLKTGRHLIETVICPINLSDCLSLELRRPELGIDIQCTYSEELESHFSYSAKKYPLINRIKDELNTSSNIAIKAARLFFDRYKLSDRFGLSIKLLKRVPFQAGLGGGSADAAAVLRGLTMLFQSEID